MIDLLLLIIMASYAISGYRQGLAVGGLSLGGFLGGAILAMFVVPALTQNLQPGMQRSFVVLIGVLLFAWLGQLAGAVIGGKLRESMRWRPVQHVDQLFGALAGVISVVLVMWFVGGALRGSPSPVISRAVASSRVLTAVDRLMPTQVSTLADGFRQAVAGTGFPRVFSGVAPEDILPVEPPNASAMSAATLNKAARSIVKITGDARACGRGQEGSGSVVSPQHVVTNAHVVAGVTHPTVQVGGVGRIYQARVVLFDPERDIAVLYAPALPAPALGLGSDLGRGDDAVVAGFPRNGPFTAGAARVRSLLSAAGDNIYGRPGVVRKVYQLYATVEPGNSGGPVLNPAGAMVGIVFAKSLDNSSTGYALTMGESLPEIQAGSSATQQVSTKGCAVG